MMMDKDQEPLIKAHIVTSYGPVLERTLLTFILKDINEIISSIRIKYKPSTSFEQRMQIRDEALQSNSVKRSLLTRLNALKTLRADVAHEVIKQYDLEQSSDLTFYQDVMEEYLEEKAKVLEEWILGGAYHLISERLNQLTMH